MLYSSDLAGLTDQGHACMPVSSPRESQVIFKAHSPTVICSLLPFLKNLEYFFYPLGHCAVISGKKPNAEKEQQPNFLYKEVDKLQCRVQNTGIFFLVIFTKHTQASTGSIEMVKAAKSHLCCMHWGSLPCMWTSKIS